MAVFYRLALMTGLTFTQYETSGSGVGVNIMEFTIFIEHECAPERLYGSVMLVSKNDTKPGKMDAK